MPDLNHFKGLHDKLSADPNWPQLYLFKFIVPNDNQKIALAQALFGDEAEVKMNKSRTGKYISISAKEMMLSAEEVIQVYNESNRIEGIIAL